MNKYITFALIVVLAAVLDIATKTWAERHLGTRTADWTHGFDTEVAEDEAGLTVREWVSQRFDVDPTSDEALAMAASVHLDGVDGMRLPPSHEIDAGDQLTVTYRRIPVVDGFWSFGYVRNFGAAWSLFANKSASFRRPFFMGISVIAMLLVLVILRGLAPDKRWLVVALGLIVGGAMGNLIDRIRYGYVVDFIDWYVVTANGEKHWPTFNVADVWIAIGVGLMLLDALFGHHEAEEKVPKQKEDPAAAEA